MPHMMGSVAAGSCLRIRTSSEVSELPSFDPDGRTDSWWHCLSMSCTSHNGTSVSSASPSCVTLPTFLVWQVRVQALIMHELRCAMPKMAGKDKKQRELIASLEGVFLKVMA